MLTTAILVCTTLIANGADGTVATKSCHFEQQPTAATAANSFEKLSLRIINDVEDASLPLNTNPASLDVKPISLKVQQTEDRRVLHTANLSQRRVHPNFGKTRVIPVADVSLPSRKSLSFWDKLKQEPASNFKPIVTD